jgi:hypothetical protein
MKKPTNVLAKLTSFIQPFITKLKTKLGSNPNQKLLALGFIAFFAIIGTYFLLATKAAGPFASIDLGSTSVTSPVTNITDQTASGGSAVQFGSGTTTPPPPSSGICTGRTAPTADAPYGGVPADKFPGAACTGVPAGVTLTEYTGPMTISTSVTITDKTFNGSVCINASNVTIKRSKVIGTIETGSGGSWGACPGTTPSNVVIEDVEIIGPGTPSTYDASIASSFAFSGSGFTCRRCNLHRWGSGFYVRRDVQIVDSYVHDMVGFYDASKTHPGCGILGPDCMAHRSCIGGNGAENASYLHNNLQCNDLNGQPGVSGGLVAYVQPEIINVRIENNLLGPYGSYCLYAGSGGNNPVQSLTVINNLFERGSSGICGLYGPILWGTGNITRAGNSYTDGTPIP